jgi:hypothetical protein
MPPVRRYNKVTIQVCLTQDEYDRLMLLAIREQRSISQMSRVIIGERIGNEFPIMEAVNAD